MLHFTIKNKDSGFIKEINGESFLKACLNNGLNVDNWQVQEVKTFVLL